MDNRRKTIVINKKFQYQYSLLIAALTVLLVNGYIILRMMIPSEQPLELSGAAIWWLAGVEFVLVASIWYGSLKASHRIAGPMYVFSREVSKLGSGDFTAHIRLRDKDLFKLEAEAMNGSFNALRTKILDIQGAFGELKGLQDQGADTGAAMQRLEELLSALSTGTEE